MCGTPSDRAAMRCAGAGTVKFTTGTQFVLAEWWGAVGNGKADDSTAIQKAYEAAWPAGVWQGTVGCAKLLQRY